MITAVLPRAADVVVVGAGVVGAACAEALYRAGLQVCVIDRLGPAAGSSSAGEGNLLVSDKRPGPELELAQLSLRLWREFAGRTRRPFEFDAKGGVVVARDDAAAAGLRATAADQRAAGVDVRLVDATGLAELEPELTREVSLGAHYPEDAQVQPMLAVRALLAAAQVTVVAGCELLAVARDPAGDLVTVITSRGRINTSRVIVAAGAQSAELAALVDGRAAVRPRRGHIVVTEPMPRLVRHKVYEADYVAAVESDESTLLVSAVVEGTDAGPILLGSSRELVGFDRRPSLTAIQRITKQAIELFPFLADVRVLRTYLGFRPATPDHLPIIGADATVAGVWYATGHEGAGVGLALGTAELLRALILDEVPPLDAAPFSPSRPSLVLLDA
jgi:D-hydroxyproline dehydrogenase subunit beta